MTYIRMNFWLLNGDHSVDRKTQRLNVIFVHREGMIKQELRNDHSGYDVRYGVKRKLTWGGLAWRNKKFFVTLSSKGTELLSSTTSNEMIN